MVFVFSVITAYLITVPGMYLLFRLRLASSIIEGVAAGFFLGFGLVVLVYLALSRLLPVYYADVFVCFVGIATLLPMVRQWRQQKLPFWSAPADAVQIFVVLIVLVFMVTFAFGDLTNIIDDDLFIHLPIIKRVAMGDVPPHVPYFPDSYLRGHFGRDLFTGTVARLCYLRPELGIVYVTLACCPAYVLSFHALANRLGQGRRWPTCFCFIGLLFLVSAAIGPYAIRAGSITYVFNNNAFAFGYAAFFAWLLERTVTAIGEVGKPQSNIFVIFVANWPIISLCTVAHAASYFVYLSNFLMFSLFLAALPALLAVFGGREWRARFFEAVLGVALGVGGAVILLLLVSPNFWERLMITLHIAVPSEPLGFIQQAQFSFPKAHPFAITSPSGDDVAFFTAANLSVQGASFYIGVLALIVGVALRNVRLAALSLLGWLTMLWMMLVDMGQYRGESLRLFLLAHIAFGGATGLVIGLALQRIAVWSRQTFKPGLAAAPRQLSAPSLATGAAVAMATGFCVWMGWGNVEKVLASGNYDVAASVHRLGKLVAKDPEDWNRYLNLVNIDFEAFQLLADRISSPKSRLLLNVLPDARYRGTHIPAVDDALAINAGAMTGAGLVGVTQEHAPPHMSVALYLQDYRATLFWHLPSAELLRQLSPDWILVDPDLLSAATLDQVRSLPGVELVRSLSDSTGRRRLLLHYSTAQPYAAPPSNVQRLVLEGQEVATTASSLIEIPARVETVTSSSTIRLAMLVVGDDGQIANTMDMPIIGIEPLGADRTKLQFALIQPGQWSVYFIDPASGDRLNQEALKVTVKE
ncbi:MAG: hypothetical protein ACLP19_08590 [Xanthobacteraceae bacterium]